MYVGTDDGNVWTTKNLGATWREIDDGLPLRWVTRVAIHPRDEDIAYVTLSGFRRGDNSSHVFRTMDGGGSWENISANLPDAPANDIVIHPQHPSDLYVATDVGVYASQNGGKKWLKLGSGLPLAPVTDIRYHAGTETLTAATFGRGFFRIQL